MPEPTPVPEHHANDCDIVVHLADDAMAVAYADQGETVPERDCTCGLYDRIAAEPTPVPDAAEVLAEHERKVVAYWRAWRNTADIVAVVDRLVERIDALTAAASPDASLSPAPEGRLSAEERGIVERARCLGDTNDGGRWFTYESRLVNIIDRLSASSAPLPDDEQGDQP